MTHLFYRLLGVVVLWTSCIHCQLTLYQATNDLWELASATLQEVGAADGATTYIHVVGGGSDVILETVVVSASGFSEDTDNTILGLHITGGCQIAAATSVSCEIGNAFSSDVAVGTPLPFKVAVETIVVTSQNPTTSATPQITGVSLFSADTSFVFNANTITGTPMPSPSFATGTPKPSFLSSSATGIARPSSISTSSNDVSKTSKSSAPVIGGVVGGIILLLLLVFLACWLVRRRRAKQAFLNATRATIYSESFGASNYNTRATSPIIPQDTKQGFSEGYSNSEEVAALQKQLAEMLGGSRTRRY